VINVSDLPSGFHGARAGLAGADYLSRIIPIVEMEKNAIVSTIAQLNGDKLMAAKMLGIGKTTLYRKLKGYDLQV
jgi:transcriptional regulator of acetoin/glycerol metabolism